MTRITGGFELTTNEKNTVFTVNTFRISTPKECDDVIRIIEAIKATILANLAR